MWVQAEDAAAVFNTGRFMFVFNTKLCQKDKAAQFSTRKGQLCASRVAFVLLPLLPLLVFLFANSRGASFAPLCRARGYPAPCCSSWANTLGGPCNCFRLCYLEAMRGK